MRNATTSPCAKRCASSMSSAVSQAATSPAARNSRRHCAKREVLPNPAGASTRMIGLLKSSLAPVDSRGRNWKFCGARGGVVLRIKSPVSSPVYLSGRPTPPSSTSWRRTSSPAIRSATSELRSFSLRPATILSDFGRKPALHRCAASARFRRRRERPSGINSTAAEIAPPIARYTSSPSDACGPTREPRTTCSSDSRRTFQTRRHSSPEALPSQRGLHAHHSTSQGDQRDASRRLTNRRASRAASSPARISPAC